MKARFFPLILSLLVASVLVVLVEDFVRQVIIDPLLYVSWYISLVVGSIPQLAFWGAFILIAVVIARKSLARERTISNRAALPTHGTEGPVTAWAKRLERAKTQEYSRWRLAQTLGRLSSSILIPDATQNHQQRANKSEYAEWVLPPEIEAYFEAPIPWSGRAWRFWHRLRVSEHPTELDLDPKIVVEFLEHKLDPLGGE